MIFVINYDRAAGKSRWIVTFPDFEMEQAQGLRLKSEMDARNEVPRPEIVVLSAETEDQLRRSHSKYFGDEAIGKNILRARR